MHYVHQDGAAVYKFAVRKMAEAAETVLTRNGLTGKDLACFIPHQANKRIILSTAERLGMDESCVVINIDRFGNTTAATIPMAMQTALDEGRLKKGDLVLLASVGAGFHRWVRPLSAVGVLAHRGSALGAACPRALASRQGGRFAGSSTAVVKRVPDADQDRHPEKNQHRRAPLVKKRFQRFSTAAP